MKVLMLNGGPHKSGCTNAALTEVASALGAEGIESDILWLGMEPLRDCVACGGCARTGSCVIKGDIVERIVEKARTSDGFVFGCPVYYAHPTGSLFSALDRAFYSGGRFFANKPGAAVVSARRGGTTAALDAINKYFTINRMPVVSSTYWNMVHGSKAEDVYLDKEGVQTMHNIGRSMAWLLKCIELGRENGLTAPGAELGAKTNFIR